MQIVKDRIVVDHHLFTMSLQFDELRTLIQVAGDGLYDHPEFNKYVRIVNEMTKAWIVEIYRMNGVKYQ
jgi:hypothetical protein